MKSIAIILLMISCVSLRSEENGLKIIQFSLRSEEKELKFIEFAPIFIQDHEVLSFEDKDTNLYLIVTKSNQIIDTNKYYALEEGSWYKLKLEFNTKVYKVLFYMRGGRYKYFYLDYIKNDMLVGDIYSSPNIIGRYYQK